MSQYTKEDWGCAGIIGVIICGAMAAGYLGGAEVFWWYILGCVVALIIAMIITHQKEKKREKIWEEEQQERLHIFEETKVELAAKYGEPTLYISFSQFNPDMNYIEYGQGEMLYLFGEIVPFSAITHAEYETITRNETNVITRTGSIPTDASDMISRAAVGGFIGGKKWALIGAMTTPNTKKVTYNEYVTSPVFEHSLIVTISNPNPVTRTFKYLDDIDKLIKVNDRLNTIITKNQT